MANRILEIQQRLQRKYESGAKPALSASLPRRAASLSIPSADYSRRARALSDQSFDLRFQVPLVPQQTGMSCWAAGAAMVVAWRENYSADPARIAQAAGEWAAYSAGLHPESTSIFPIWGLTPEPQQSYTIDAFRQLLETYGPLWVAGAVPGPHIRVVTGLYGDGTPDGTRVLINDPWQKGMTTFSLPNAGAQYEETYTQFVAETERLATQEAKSFPNAIYIARSTRPRASRSQSRSFSGIVHSNGARPVFSVVPNFRARALSMPVEFDVPRPVPPIKQPSPMTSWAAATAMLVSYKDGKPVSIEEAVRRAGDRYLQLLRREAALARADMADFLGALGLVSEPAVELDVQNLHQMLRRFGAIWLTPDSDPAFSLDARIISGIHGDGTPHGTKLTMIDPNNGAEARVAVDRLSSLFQLQATSPLSGLTAISWPPDTLGAVVPQGESAVPQGAGTASAQSSWGRSLSSIPATHSYKFRNPSNVVAELSDYSFAQNPGPMIAGILVTDALQIGLGAIAVAQSQVAASQGSFSLSYSEAERLLTSEARAQMPGSQSSKKKYSQRLFWLGLSGRLNAAKAEVIIEWEGNPYGEISTPVIRRNLATSTEWTRSSANITITRFKGIPLPGTDPRAWPIVYTYEGTYDPFGNGHFEFSGEFEINAFGGLKFTRHEVVSRSLADWADWALWGDPEDKVKKGKDVNVTVPEIPQDQVAYLKTRLP